MERSSRQSTRQGLFKFGPPVQRSGKIAGNGPDDFSVGKLGIPSTRLTQEDQDNADEEKQRESMHTLVQTWLDSLQLISVITTFFVATEASWLLLSIPDRSDHGSLSTKGQIANIGILCALIVHSFAAVISFLAAFCLIGFKLSVAQKEKGKVQENLVGSPKPMSLNDPEKSGSSQADDLPRVCQPVRINSPLSGDKVIWSTNPHLVQVGFFQGPPPTELLSRCHSFCVFLSFVGFLLAFVGAISFTWDQLPRSIGISTSISTVFCVVAAMSIIFVPSTKSSHILYN